MSNSTMKARLQSAMKESLKAKNQIRLNAIRGVLSACQYEAMEKKVDELPDDATISVIQREIKKRREEIDFAKQANRTELLEKFDAEIKTLEEFLPQQLTESQLQSEISSYLVSNPGSKNMGLLMKYLKEKYAGQYDPKLASELAKRACA